MNIKDGDFFSYSWKTGYDPLSDRYWCRDARCVARADKFGDIVLIDTYNYWPFKDGKEDTNIFTHEGLSREYSKYVNTDSFDLEFICNLDDYEFVSEYEKDDYENVIFVGYQCTRKWAIPRGSVKSNKAIIKKLQKELVDEISKHENAAWRIRKIEEQLSTLF